MKTCYKVTGNRQGENRDDYAFTVDNTGNESGVVDLKVGGVAITSILIDSGATCNIMDKAIWEMLKKDGVKCSHMDNINPLMSLEHLWQRLSVKIMTGSVKVNSLS